MKKTVLMVLLSCVLSNCSLLHVHKMAVQQGNVMTDTMVSQIHVGMTTQEVKDILGPPVLTNVFDRSRIDYVYTYKPGYGTLQKKYLTLIIKNNRVKEIAGNHYSTFIQ